MKILLVRPGPSFSVQDVAFGWRDGLRQCGAEVADVNYDDRLELYGSVHLKRDDEWRHVFPWGEAVKFAARSILADCFTFWPDVVIFVSAFFIPPQYAEVIRARGIRTVYMFTESPYEDDRQLHMAPQVDMVLLNDPTNLEQFRAVNPETFYIPHAYNPARHYPGPPNPEMACDFGFVGTGFPSRVAFLEAVDFEGLDVLLGGSWVSLPDESPLAPLIGHRRDWCMDNAETAELYRSAKTSLNLYRREVGHNGAEGAGPDTSAGWAMGPREVELAACGTFFLRDPRPEGDELFPMLPTFSEPGEVRPLLDWWLAHDDERHEAALKARAAIADRTFQANAAWFLEHLGG